jgi:hypothetical protein
LIEDANSTEYYHPTVHYIFSDDDTDLVTEAVLRALEAGQSTSPRDSKLGYARGQEEALEYGNDNKPRPHHTKLSSLPTPVAGTRERYIVLDMELSHSEPSNPAIPATAGNASTTTAAAGAPSTPPAPPADPSQPLAQNFIVTSAHSLTPSWQVLNARLCTAPTFDSSANNTATTSNDPSPVAGLMLKIEGTAGFDNSSSKPQTPQGENLEQTMERFEKRMGELRRVIEAAGGDAPPGERESKNVMDGKT